MRVSVQKKGKVKVSVALVYLYKKYAYFERENALESTTVRD